MEKRYDIVEIKENVLADNDRVAGKIREELRRSNTCFINLMASPGAGKTSLLIKTIEALKDKYSIGVMEADADGDVDAKTISALGVRTLQIHTGGLCHMDADMTFRGLKELGFEDLDLIFLENVGNLVCPAEFDVGAALQVMILSVPEGDDKPLKYPLMFKVSDCMLVNKIDAEAVFDFDYEACVERARALNPEIRPFRLSALKGESVDEWIRYLDGFIREWRK